MVAAPAASYGVELQDPEEEYAKAYDKAVRAAICGKYPIAPRADPPPCPGVRVCVCVCLFICVCVCVSVCVYVCMRVCVYA